MNAKVLGKLKIDPIAWVMCISMILAPLYTYHKSVSTGQQPPFPHATITDTATHYPQDIWFRYIMLTNSSFLALAFYLAYRWMQHQACRVGFAKLPKLQFYLAQFSILCYSITLGTIDELGIGNLHTPCAIIFFIIWLGTIVNMTVYMTRMREWDSSVISKGSLRLKQLLSAYITLVWAWCLYNINQQPSQNKQDIYVVIVQWNSVFINILWILSLVIQWKDISMCLVSQKTH